MACRSYVATQGIGSLYTTNEESNTLNFSSRVELSSSYTIALALREALGGQDSQLLTLEISDVEVGSTFPWITETYENFHRNFHS